jgi:hypothetical protein
MSRLKDLREPISREGEAREAKWKHGKAARIWDAIQTEQPHRRAVAKILADWMFAYENADADAENAFRALHQEKP